jgi:trehalose synthase
LQYRGEQLRDLKILTVNAAKDGGGVAQILSSLIPLLRDVGMDIDWAVIDEDEEFFDITKRFHNGLQGEDIPLSEADKRRYKQRNDVFWSSLDKTYDAYLIHDPQPAALIDHINAPAFLRLHMDLSSPDDKTWRFLQPYFDEYDELIVSQDQYYHDDLTTPYRVIPPATDPFTAINQELSEATVRDHLEERIGPHENLISQVSRFDKWKDPEGVIDVFETVRQDVDAHLLLLGSDAEDDPEGQAVYDAVKQRQAQSPVADDITVIMENNAELVNAAQRGSDIVVQKSIREGFGLTVSEAMLKGTPVVASNVGGITEQIQHGENGFLHDPHDHDSFANTILNVLDDEEMQEVIGRNAKQTVQQRFLLTRLAEDYLDLFHDKLL